MSHTSTTDNLFSCDLFLAAKQHLSFLRRLHALGVTLTAVSPAMVDRYLNKWLPLVAAAVAGTGEGTVDNDHDHQQFVQQPPLLIPPPGVSWLWHCHRLAPACYRTYTQQEFGRVLEAHPSFAFQEQQQDADQVEESTSERAKRDTIAAWKKAYPDQPFFLSTAEDNTVTSNDEETKEPSNHRHPKQRPCVVCQLDGFDLIASTLCQALFLWQVSGPRFTDDAFLRDGVERYYKFLQLQHFENESSSSSLPIVPTYQIDLMWHTHILVSCHGYRNDCLRIRGHEFHHDDSLNDRSPGAKLERAFAATVQLWNEAYNTDNNKNNNNSDYIVPGGMYRGEPPSAFYDTETWSRQLNGYDAGDQLTVPASTTTTTTTAAPITLVGSSSSGRNVTTPSVAIWKFEDDTGWKSYSSVHQQLLEQAYQSCTTSTAAAAAPTASSSGTTTTPGVVQVKSGTHTYEVNVQAMTQTNVERPCRKQRNVRRRLGGSGSKNTPPVWEWQDDDNNAWIEYGGVQQQQIEDAYQRLSQPPPTGKVQFQIGQQMFYEVDVKTMIQTSIEHGTRRQRNIRRSYGPPAPWQIPTTGLHFHPARRKSRTRNVNSNEKMEGFVFGRGTAGDGFYSLETQDAYRIMRLRLAIRARYAQAQVDGYDCSHCLCWGRTPTPNEVRERLALENKCNELRYMSAYMKAKSRAAGPVVEPDRKTIESYLVPAGPTTTTGAAAARTTTGNRTSDTTTGGDYYGSPVPYYWYTGYYCYSAAGCGGGDGGCGAGCGGGACGGGGCGGGACGGGACGGGGGGCGGGGCGGGC